ncbi:hypothetical protein Bca4012_021573 [Brassica carinata]|uniref:Uncharacterized protein n=1 Tax=Brassica carinata TaxID=52824 RepID=A0A8X7PW04_BRACI|nr:hypothetical protein Bca52824_077601 [Brassica carinata]
MKRALSKEKPKMGIYYNSKNPEKRIKEAEGKEDTRTYSSRTESISMEETKLKPKKTQPQSTSERRCSLRFLFKQINEIPENENVDAHGQEDNLQVERQRESIEWQTREAQENVQKPRHRKSDEFLEDQRVKEKAIPDSQGLNRIKDISQNTYERRRDRAMLRCRGERLKRAWKKQD